MANDFYDDDITSLWDSRFELTHIPEEEIPRLEDWFAISQGERLIISGIVFGHARIEDKRRISTSAVQNFKTTDDGITYVATKNSKYKLGRQLSINESETQFGKSTSHMTRCL
ncbi:MAG TPA: hypothetical protein V6D19_17775 [Stenomitos sp.]